jgi:hypothetical protein
LGRRYESNVCIESENSLLCRSSSYFRLFFKIGWYGTSETSKKATEALIASKTRIYTDKDVNIISQKVFNGWIAMLVFLP